MRQQAVYWLCLICITISLSTASARLKRDIQTIRTIKDLLFDKVFGSPPEGTVVAAENPEVKLFKIPGHDNILVKATPVVAPEAVVEVIPPPAPIHPTVALIQSYLGTTTMNETLKALDGVQLLLHSGILGRPALDKLFVSHPPTSEIRASDAIFSSDLHLPGSHSAPLPFKVVEKTINGPLHSSYGVPIDAPVVFDKPVEIKDLPRPEGVPHTTYGVPLPEPLVLSERKPIAVDVFPGPAIYQSYPSPFPQQGFGPFPAQELKPLPVQEIRPLQVISPLPVQEVRYFPGPQPVQDVRFIPGPELRPLPVPELRPLPLPVPEYRPLPGHEISFLQGQEFRPLPVPGFKPLPDQEIRFLQGQEFRPLPVSGFRPLPDQEIRFLQGQEFRPLPVPGFRPLPDQEIRFLHGQEFRPLPVPGFRPLPDQEIRFLQGQEFRPLPVSGSRPQPDQEIRFLQGPEFRPLRVPFGPLPGPELRPLPVSELRPLPVPEFRPLSVPNYKPVPVANLKPVQVEKIVSNPFKSIYSYTPDGVVFASEGGKLRKVPFHPITAVRPIIVERIKQISEKMANLPKPVKVEIKPPLVPVAFEYFQVPKIAAVPFTVAETVNKQSGSFIYGQVKQNGTEVYFDGPKKVPDMRPIVLSRIKEIANMTATTTTTTLAKLFLSRLIKKSDEHGGYYYELTNDDGSVTMFSAEEIEQALPLSDTNSVTPAEPPVVVVPEHPPILSRLVKKPNGHGGYYYEQINDDGTISIFKRADIESGGLGAILSRLVKKPDGHGGYYYELINDDGTISILKPEEVESGGLGANIASRIKPTSEEDANNISRGSSKYLYRQINADGTVTIYSGFQEQVDVKMPDEAEIDFTVPSRFSGASVTTISGNDVKPVVAGDVSIFNIPKGSVDVHPIPKLPTTGYSFQQVNADGSVTTFPESRHSVLTKLPAILTEIVPPRLTGAAPVFVRPDISAVNPAIVSSPEFPVVVPVSKAPEFGPVHVHSIPDKSAHGIIVEQAKPSVEIRLPEISGSVVAVPAVTHAVPAPIAVFKPAVPEIHQSIPSIIEAPKAPHFEPVHVHEIQEIPAVAAPPTIYGIPINNPIKKSKPFVSALPRISVPSFRPEPDAEAEATIGPDYVFIPPETDYKAPVVTSYVYKQVVSGKPDADVTHVNINGQSNTDSAVQTQDVTEKGNKDDGVPKQAVHASGVFNYSQILTNRPTSQDSSFTENSPTTETITNSEEGSLSQNPIVVSEDKGQYSYKQSDGSTLQVLGNDENEVTVDVDIDIEDKEESHRGDVP